jgi:hypothetical protein
MLRKIAGFLLVVVVVTVAGYSWVGAASPEQEAADSALDYIRSVQNADGGFPDFVADSTAGATLDAVFAFAAAGINAGAVRKNDGASPIDYLEDNALAYSDKAGPAAKLVLGLVALNQDPRDFAGADFVSEMESHFDGADHSYGEGVFDHCIYILARSKLGLSPASGSVDHLKSKQTADGCWEYGDGWGCDTNTTSMAIQALVEVGVPVADGAVQDALDYLAGARNSDGGWPYDPLSQWGTDSDANSTAFVVQALVAAGENINSGGPWERQGNTPVEALLAFQNPQTGAFTYGGLDSVYATYQAVPALLLRTYSLPTATPEDEETATPRPTKTPTTTATPTSVPTATPAATATPQPAIVPAGASPAAPTPFSQVLAMPRSGSGGPPAGDAAVPVAAALLLLTGAGATASLLVARARRG